MCVRVFEVFEEVLVFILHASFLVFDRILAICHKAMFKQLRDWLIYGMLNDKYTEFFICLNDKKEVQAKNEENDECGVGLGFTVDELTEIGELLANDNRSCSCSRSSRSAYMLNAKMFPSYLNLKTANKILFAGESLQMFKPLIMADDGTRAFNDEKAISKSMKLALIEPCCAIYISL